MPLAKESRESCGAQIVPVTFDATCGSAQLVNHYDNCTGGHFEIGQGMTLTKR